jgi:uncharacterized membrane-anchored protein
MQRAVKMNTNSQQTENVAGAESAQTARDKARCASASGSDVQVSQMTLRDMLAAGATEKDVDGILQENIQAYINGNKIHDRQTARWEHADRMMKHRQNDQALRLADASQSATKKEKP